MALQISKNSQLTDIVSDVNPITTEHNISGESKVVELWLFNDNPQKRYTNISASAIDTSLGDGDQSNWIQFSNDGTNFLPSGTSLTFADVTTNSIKFWVKVTTPTVADSQNVTSLKIQIQAKEYAV